MSFRAFLCRFRVSFPISGHLRHPGRSNVLFSHPPGLRLRHNQNRQQLSIRADNMSKIGALQRENETLRDRLSKLSEASPRINKSLDFETLFQKVLASAGSLPRACYGVVTLLDGSEEVQNYLAHGMPAEKAQ